MEDIVIRFVTNLIGRLSGPLTPRLFLQPAVAIFLAVRDGVKDAREQRPPHFLRIVTGTPEVRRRRVRETRRAVLKVFMMAVLLDWVYQFLVFRWVYPVEAMVTAVILAILPYMAIRGPVNRIARRWIKRQGGSAR